MKVVQISESEFSVQGHGVHTAYLETCQALAKYSNVTLTKNNFQSADVRHIHTVGPYALAQLLLARGAKVVSAHVVPESFVGSLAGTKYWLWLAKLYLRWFYNRAELVLAVSDQTKQDLLTLGVTSPIEVLCNMVDTAKYQSTHQQKLALRKKYKIAPEAKVVIGNGQIQPRKRIDSFIATATALPDVTFIWVGGMPFGRAAASHGDMNKIIKNAPSNVIITGIVPLEQVAEYFCIGDAFVMTSEQETFGLAIVEAAASGLPVVLRDIDDYDTTFRSFALMCQEDEFAPTINALLGDTALYKKQRTLAKKLATRYSSESATAQLLAAYNSVLSV